MLRDDSGVIEHRYDTKENWEKTNPILARGELGIEMEYGLAKLKVGDGATSWNGLDYIRNSSTSDNSDINASELEKIINKAKEEAVNKIDTAKSNALTSLNSLAQNVESAVYTVTEAQKSATNSAEKAELMANSIAVAYPIGAVYPSLHNKVDAGSLPLIYGETYSRTKYIGLWAYANSIEGYVKSDAEWLSLYKTNEGNVPYFSSGDGNNTFRVPCIKDFVQGSEGLEDVGIYSTDMQRNISGSFEALGWSNSVGTTGSFDSTIVHSDRTASSGNEFGTCHFDLDAVTSVGPEHTGNSVKPKSVKILWQIKATGSSASSSFTVNIPNGVIISFSGSFDENNNPIDQITKEPCIGWVLCDGTNGTPDLRGRFIIGSSENIEFGSSGGEEVHKLSLEEMPLHNHTAWTDYQGNHNHAINRTGNGGGSWTGIAGSPSNQYAGWDWTDLSYTGEHAHSVGIGSTGGNAAHNNMPPYYALAYIMKIQE